MFANLLIIIHPLIKIYKKKGNKLPLLENNIPKDIH